ncbi:E3 ubiquitin-protein ligase IPI1 [Elaeis guineensis]|uniref:E3 ubiquitin-protein ligase RFI2 n=1 Tax=Elaeis guineensis var. tenera TaxID=51953 RepID=A0A6I9QHA3_ELAGV|nr:E3 ubiquitin-protein ligase RFI2 [Elaeis guineensis]
MSGLEAMNLEKVEFSNEGKGAMSAASSCSICLELVLNQGDRSTARLQCGHEFHLDCIGSAFNAKGAMQCPNCRKVEKGRWLYANGHCSSSEFDFDGWITEDIYDLGYSELPFGIQWCPFRGYTQLASLFEEGEPQPNSYRELMGNPAYGDHSSASSSSHVCPYLAMHGFPHAVHAAPSSSADSLPENGPFHRHPSSMGGQSSADMINSHGFPATEPQNPNWQQQHSFTLPLSGNNDQSASQFGLRLSRNDTSSQQRLGSFVHPHPLMHGSISRSGNNLLGSLGPPVMGEARGHTRGLGSHIYQQSVSSSSVRSSPFAPIRRMRPRGVTLISSVATSSSAEIGGFYGFSVSGSVSRNHQEGENIGRHIDQFYGWGREGFTPLPWIPVEGESQWWSPFNPNQNPQPGSFTQRTASERVTQSRPENGFQRMTPRMPPYM